MPTLVTHSLRQSLKSWRLKVHAAQGFAVESLTPNLTPKPSVDAMDGQCWKRLELPIYLAIIEKTGRPRIDELRFL